MTPVVHFNEQNKTWFQEQSEAKTEVPEEWPSKTFHLSVLSSPVHVGSSLVLCSCPSHIVIKEVIAAGLKTSYFFPHFAFFISVVCVLVVGRIFETPREDQEQV